MKLWEHKHPYYMCEGSRCQVGQIESYASWEEFIEEWTNDDVDLNCVVACPANKATKFELWSKGIESVAVIPGLNIVKK